MKLPLALGALALLAGCGSVPSAGGNDGQVSSASLVHSYTSLQDLADGSQVVAEVEIGRIQDVDAAESGDSGLPANLDDFTTVESYKGTLPASGQLRMMIETGGGVSEDLPPSLESGQVYVVFMNPFEWHRGRPVDGVWYPTGAIGIYAVEGTTLSLVPDAPDHNLPQTTTVEAVRAVS